MTKPVEFVAAQPAPTAHLQRTALAMAVVVLLHVIVVAVIAELLWASVDRRPTILRPPPQPLLLTAVALLLAHCSLGGIWWARTKWPMHAKTLAAVLACLAIFGMLLAILPEGRSQADHAAGWAASFATQFVLTSLMAAALELAVQYRQITARHRFTILSLLIWTTLVGSFLAGGRWLVTRFGWTAENFFAWEYFQQLQVLGAANAALAIAILAGVRLTPNWYTRSTACAATLLVAAPLTVGCMWTLFGSRVGVSLSELAWLITAEGLFLIVTLVPLEMTRARGYISK
jgi:hypothetical protein